MKLFLIAITITAIASTAIADPTAEDLYAAGQSAYDRGDYTGAIERWQLAYQISGADGLLFNIAQAQRLSGDCTTAITTYLRFIAAAPTSISEQHQLAVEFVHELTPTCPATPEPKLVDGLHLVDGLSRTGLVDGLHLVDGLSRTGSANAGRSLKIAGLATGGAGALAIVVGLAVGHHGQTIGDEITRSCTVSCAWSAQEAHDATGRRDVTAGYVLDSLGAAAIVGGAITYYLGLRHAEIEVTPHAGGAIAAWSTAW